MAWVMLVIAGLFESAWALGLPTTHGFSRLWPSVWVGAAMIVSIVLLAQAARTIPAATAYAVWVAIGVVGAFGAQAVLDRAWPSLLRTGLVLVIVLAVVGLKLTTPGAPAPDAPGDAPDDVTLRGTR